MAGGFNGSNGSSDGTDHLDYTAISGAHQGEYSILDVGFSVQMTQNFNTTFRSSTDIHSRLNAPANMYSVFSHWEILQKGGGTVNDKFVGSLSIANTNEMATYLSGTLKTIDTHPAGSYLTGPEPIVPYSILLSANSNTTLLKVPRSTSGKYLWDRAVRISNTTFSTMQNFGMSSELFYRTITADFPVVRYLHNLDFE
ncbi:MAG: hypothetical protein EOO89_21750 [Pedobacter sp.]|nr:MAG: hypothetical protein EOO89_21750 [Pedobacter sp.]